jgi:hypothetical protein
MACCREGLNRDFATTVVSAGLISSAVWTAILAADQTSGRIALISINKAAVAESLTVKLAGLSLGANLAGKQSAVFVYWKPFAAFSPSPVAAFTVILPPASVTPIDARIQSPA